MVKGRLTIRKRQPRARRKLNSVKRRPNILACPAREVKRKSRKSRKSPFGVRANLHEAVEMVTEGNRTLFEEEMGDTETTQGNLSRSVGHEVVTKSSARPRNALKSRSTVANATPCARAKALK